MLTQQSAQTVFLFPLWLLLMGCRNSAEMGNPYDLDRPGVEHIGPHSRNPSYGWEFANRGTIDIDGVGIVWHRPQMSLSANAGVLPAASLGGGKDDDSGWDPLPQEVIISWRESGIIKQRLLTVADKIDDPQHFSGTIILTYDGSNWHVTTRPPLRNRFR